MEPDNFNELPYQIQELRRELVEKASRGEALPKNVNQILDRVENNFGKMVELIEKLEGWCQRRRKLIAQSQKQLRQIREYVNLHCHSCGSTDIEAQGTDLRCRVCGEVWCNWIEEEK